MKSGQVDRRDVLLALTGSVWGLAHCARAPEHDAYARIPDVELMDQNGRAVRLRSDVFSRGTFMLHLAFTTCTGSCPSAAQNLAKVRALLTADEASAIRTVTITTEPARDTPHRMREWLEKFYTGPGWTLLTGAVRDVADAVAAITGDSLRTGQHTPFLLMGARGRQVRSSTFDHPQLLVKLARRLNSGAPEEGETT